MTTHEVACRIDDNEVEHWDNEIHALMWHVAQANTADGFRDSGPGELVERIGREIIRRWLRDILSSSTTTKAATTTGRPAAASEIGIRTASSSRTSARCPHWWTTFHSMNG